MRRYLSTLALVTLATACGSDDATVGSDSLPPESTTSTSVAPATSTTDTDVTTTTTIPVLSMMPIGDSITQGSAGWQTYRCHLDELLTTAGVVFDFVGGLSLPNGGGEYGCPRPFDTDHEGRWGGRIDEVIPDVAAAALLLQPDVALIHLGTNDILQGQGAAGTAAELATLVEELRSARSDVAVLVAQIIPCEPSFGTMCSSDLPDFNAAVRELASTLSTTQSPVIAVDMATGFLLDDLRDGVHPSDAGDLVLAERWFEALKAADLI